MYSGFSALYTPRTRVPSIEARWSEGVTPLVLDAFQIYVWAAPLTHSILACVEPGSDKTHACMVLLMLGTTLLLNCAVLPNARWFHTRTGVMDSTLFRAGWVFICACAVARYTGGGGVTGFAVVAFLPLVYVRVSGSLTGWAALYAVAFFALTLSRSVLEPSPPGAGRLLWHGSPAWHPTSWLLFGAHWLVFAVATGFHVLWASSHAHTLDRPGSSPVQAYALPSSIASVGPRAVFRSIVVLLCALVREAPPGEGGSADYLQSIRFMQTLALFVTVSTLTAWTHCQHKRANSLRSVLVASVSAAMCGLLVETIQQVAVLLLLFPVAVALDAFYFADAAATPEAHVPRKVPGKGAKGC